MEIAPSRSRLVTGGCLIFAGMLAAGAVAALATDAVNARAASSRVPSAEQSLIHSARVWELHGRGDLAQSALKKLTDTREGSASAWLLRGELDLRMADYQDASIVVERLRSRFGGSAQAASFAVEYRIAAHDRVEFATVGRLLELGRADDARVALRRLFPDGAPDGSLGIAYYELVARMPHGGAEALAGLTSLAERHRDDARYQLALVRQLLREPRYAADAVARLRGLTGRDDVRVDEVEELLASGMREMGYQRVPPRLLAEYLERHPHDASIIALRTAREQAVDERRLMGSEHLAAVVVSVQQRLQRELTVAASDPSARDAGNWLERSRMSLRAGNVALAAVELRAALAFYRHDAEAQIRMAQDLEALHADEAGLLLAAAAGADPKSVWLFDTYVRWLIDHRRAAQAIALVETRPLTDRWTARTRDALLAVGFDRRAATEEATGDVDAAMIDLANAIRCAPRDPWLRYRLARLSGIKGDVERGRAVMTAGVAAAPSDTQMRYAQALYLASIHDDTAALAAVESIAADRRSDVINSLRDRLRVTVACNSARKLKIAGDVHAADATLLAVEPIASHGIERAAELAYAWIFIGSADHGIALVEPYVRKLGSAEPTELLIWAQVLNSAEDTDRMDAVLARLSALPLSDADERSEVVRLQRSLDWRKVRRLMSHKQWADAGRQLDALLLRDPHDRELRIARAEVYLAVAQPRSASHLYASLTAEAPGDIDTQLSYVRALTESGELRSARALLRTIAPKIPLEDQGTTHVERRIELARRQLDLNQPQAALTTLASLTAAAAARPDILMLAGRAELALRHFGAARAMFARVESVAGDDSSAAQRDREAIDARLDSSVTAGVILRHQPGDAGMSRLDAATVPSAWWFPLDYDRRVRVRADAVMLDAGRPGGDAALFGSIAGNPARVPHYADGLQSGMSLGVGYETDSLAVDIGTTPLGFLRSNVVGGVEWTPKWNSTDVTLGLSRRALTNSELSYAGMRDPITGSIWGAVVQSGPYATVGLYRQNYSVSASLQAAELTGDNVSNNRFFGARVSADRRVLTLPDLSATIGLTVNEWNYQRNLSNYTFGSGGYYSPQSYVSLSLPAQFAGLHRGWSYLVRLAPSWSISSTERIALYPNDAALQAQALHAPLPPGYQSGYFPESHQIAFGFAALASAERRVARGLVFGASIDIDRTDYYHPTTLTLYVRHPFTSRSTQVGIPPQILRPYNP